MRAVGSLSHFSAFCDAYIGVKSNHSVTIGLISLLEGSGWFDLQV